MKKLGQKIRLSFPGGIIMENKRYKTHILLTIPAVHGIIRPPKTSQVLVNDLD
jgi:hypothetical protein